MALLEKALDSAAQNLGMSFPDIILILVVLSCLIIFALHVKIGLMFTVVTLTFTYIVFNLLAMPTNNILIVWILSLIMLTLSFFIRDRGLGAV